MKELDTLTNYDASNLLIKVQALEKRIKQLEKDYIWQLEFNQKLIDSIKDTYEKKS